MGEAGYWMVEYAIGIESERSETGGKSEMIWLNDLPIDSFVKVEGEKKRAIESITNWKLLDCFRHYVGSEPYILQSVQ